MSAQIAASDDLREEKMIDTGRSNLPDPPDDPPDLRDALGAWAGIILLALAAVGAFTLGTFIRDLLVYWSHR